MQVIIDGCKREYEVDAIEEIKRIKKLPCMRQYVEVRDKNGDVKNVKRDFPMFMKYTKKIQYTKNGKERERSVIKEEKDKLKSRISDSYDCPMNDLQDALGSVKFTSSTNTIPTVNFIKHINGEANRRQINKIVSYAQELELMTKENMDEEDLALYCNRYEEMLHDLRKMKIKNPKTINRLIEIALNTSTMGRKKEYLRYTRNLLKLLHDANIELFLSNFCTK